MVLDENPGGYTGLLVLQKAIRDMTRIRCGASPAVKPVASGQIWFEDHSALLESEAFSEGAVRFWRRLSFSESKRSISAMSAINL